MPKKDTWFDKKKKYIVGLFFVSRKSIDPKNRKDLGNILFMINNWVSGGVCSFFLWDFMAEYILLEFSFNLSKWVAVWVWILSTIIFSWLFDKKLCSIRDSFNHNFIWFIFNSLTFCFIFNYYWLWKSIKKTS